MSKVKRDSTDKYNVDTLGGEMNNKVIALSGWKGSGKDTVADYLAKQHGYIRLSFAARLKDLVSQLYGVPREDLDSPSRKEMPLANYPVIPTDRFTETVHTLLSDELRHGYWTPRALCILEGSVKRSVRPNHWVNTVAMEIMENLDKRYVISDMRYKSELDTLRILLEDRIIPVRINRYDTITTTDPSERDLDDCAFDITLRNTESLDKLYSKLDHHITVLNRII